MATLEAVGSRSWRPQAFGSRSFRQVDDPVVEPLWSGTRVLAHVDRRDTRLVDAAGSVHADSSLAAAVALALQADSGVLDGYLTLDASSSGEGVFQDPGADGPTAGDVARQMLLGGVASRTRNGRRGELAGPSLEDAEALRQGGGSTLVFVAVDLLAIEGEALLDVPLLERKRLLDAALAESGLVRRGAYVRPPIDTWVTTWRAMGFRAMSYKGANSRYRPGEPNDDWATTPLPQR